MGLPYGDSIEYGIMVMAYSTAHHGYAGALARHHLGVDSED